MKIFRKFLIFYQFRRFVLVYILEGILNGFWVVILKKIMKKIEKNHINFSESMILMKKATLFI